MALVYHRSKVDIETNEPEIRAIEEDGYSVAITFPDDEDDEQAVTEVLLTKEEVQEAYDLLFNT